MSHQKRTNKDRKHSENQAVPRENPASVIRFFGKNGKFSIFSNFAHTPMVIGGLRYATNEHYFQSMKFAVTDPEYAEVIRVSQTPYQSKTLGRSRNHCCNPHWDGPDGEAIRVMRRGLFCKALQCKRFYNLLTTSGDARIIEASPWDSIWGEGKDGKGQNLLGVLLMELRTKLRKFGNKIYVVKQ